MEKFNIKIISNFLGITAALNGFFMLLALPFSFYYKETQTVKGLLLSSLITFIIGGGLYFFGRDASKILKKKEGYLIVSLGWLTLTFTGALPYLFTQTIPNVSDAIFETISGYSTTGASILREIEILPKGILFWRSATHWIGGMGIIVLAIAILPLLGIGGMQLFMAEAPGPSTDKMHPRITQTAKRLWLIYFSFTLLEFILLKIAGMNWFDALNHAMATMSTGGFSTKNASIAHWNHMPWVQYIIIVFMFIAGTNFVLTYFCLKGKFKKVFQNEEFKYYLFSVIGLTFFIAFLITNYPDPSLQTTLFHPKIWGETESAIRHSAFQILAILTTTGFVSADFTTWNSLTKILIFSLFFVGGSAGSTSGGVKIVRHIIMIKNSLLEFKKLLHPNAVVRLRYTGKSISRDVVFNILSFFVLYMAIFILSAIILSFLGMDFNSAMGAAASSLGNIGPALGSLSPVNNYAHLSEAAKWFCSFLMLIGRLELFTVLILFTHFFWKDY